MKIRSIETFIVRLGFRFSFAHSLASRNSSRNLIVRLTLEDGTTGWGESVPRDYVTGETVEQAEESIQLKFSPALRQLDCQNFDRLLTSLSDLHKELSLHQQQAGASWCALETAVLDAACKVHKKKLLSVVGEPVQKEIYYGGVVPFGGKKALAAILYFYKLLGYRTVKLKVGKSLEEDLAKVSLARKIMGKDCTIRVDANCAWTLEEALKAAESFRIYGVASYEQPLPANKKEDLQKLTAAIEEAVVLDESLSSIELAEELAQEKIGSAFNIRLSKLGGLIPSMQVLKIAEEHKLEVHLGAQVGESGILSAAGRHFALANQKFANYEGSANSFLLSKDLCHENLTAGFGGRGDLNFAKDKFGLGLTIDESRLTDMCSSDGGQFVQAKAEPDSEQQVVLTKN